MSYRCVIRKIGTVLYPNGGDLLTCLSYALHDAQVIKEDAQKAVKLHNEGSFLMEAGAIINDKIHKEIKEEEKRTINLTTFNLNESIDSIDLELWNFICCCTRTKRERKSNENEDKHTKNIRKFFLLCIMMFTTNSLCTIVLHHLVADAVEVYGGSCSLLKILNRLGVSVSSDTHERLVVSVAEAKKQQGVWNDLSPHKFTVVSTDNIDFFQSHAAVYCGDQRSYHGTTIQVVQPLSSKNFGATGNAVTNNEQQITLPPINKRPAIHPPSDSPHKHGKVGPKRRRTMQPSPLKNTHSSLSTIQATSSSTLVSAKKADISHFQESESEEVSKNKLLTEAFAYFLQKVVMQNDNADVLKPFCDFILPTEAQLKDHSASSIHYLALINDNADSDETMAHVAELVLEQICSSYQGPVVLMGDGKTFEHLQHVKQLYGNALSKILLFPGDWHVLKNFQQVLMKGYYHTGLKNIAIKSGHRGETLKSLESCSHFKRTHHFLLQSWEAMFTEMVLSFLNANPQIDLKSSIQSIIDQNYSPPDHLLSIKEMPAEKSLFSEFRTYVTEQSKLDDTWRLWANFILADCFCYVSLYVAIRMSSWDLRIGSLKSMASLFSAFDRPCYQKLLPQHISDIANYPSDVIECFRAGGFTVKITDGIGHAIALDEAHEMCVN